MFKIIEEQGDLLKKYDEFPISIACVMSMDFMLKKTIGGQIKDRFGKEDELRRQRENVVGNVAHLYVPEEKAHGLTNVHVFYMIVKNGFRDSMEKQDLTQCLIALQRACIKYKVLELMIPRIGSEFGVHGWQDMRMIIKRIFSTVNMTMYVYNIPYSRKPEPTRRFVSEDRSYVQERPRKRLRSRSRSKSRSRSRSPPQQQRQVNGFKQIQNSTDSSMDIRIQSIDRKLDTINNKMECILRHFKEKKDSQYISLEDVNIDNDDATAAAAADEDYEEEKNERRISVLGDLL